ncbi:hypothetical protein ACQCSX_21965 (plasmid) [Pseudarthrobacter sp. P1]|uniref:hypothetical protein n=1 Tax=Pseudarthrobacter sp. P1 TaxID=3418418 RepID=UPI003CF68FA9
MEQRIFRLSRAGGIDTNPTTFTQRAGTFASAATNSGQATLLTRREKTGLNGYLILPATSLGTNAPLHLAHTVGARAEEAELPTDLGDTEAIGSLTYKPSPALRETQSGIDPTELPRLLANALPEGSWVAVTMRKPSNKERKFYTPWLGNRLGTAVPTHHSTSPTAVLVSIAAGGNSREEVTSLLSQVTAGLPGFDLDSGVRFAPKRHALFLGLPIGLVLAAATLFGLPQVPAAYAAYIPAGIAPLLYAISGVAATLGLAALTGRISSPDTKLRNRLAAAAFPSPAARRGRPRPPRKERTIKGSRMVGGEKVPYEKFVPASDGDYPLAPETFMVGPNVVVGMVSPHAGAVSGVAATRARSTPPAMLQPIGPMLGTNDDGSAHLSADAMRFSVAIVGKPGSGKAESLDARFPVPVSDKFPTGWALNRELVVGDQVFSTGGGVTNVAGFSEPFDGDMFEVRFSDGQKVRTDAGHLWAVSSRTTRRRDGSGVLTGKMAEVDRRAEEEAKRLRGIAEQIEPGTMAAGNDMARVSGIGAGVLLRFVRKAGIDSVRAQVAVRPEGPTNARRARVRFDAVSAKKALLDLSAKKTSTVGRIGVASFTPRHGHLMTAREVLVACGAAAPRTADVSQMNERLKTAGVPRVRDSHNVLLPTKATFKTLEVYPLREVLIRYADHIEAGKERAARVQLRTTAELAAAVRVSAENAVNWAIDLAAPVEGQEIDAVLDPYVLGAWLGDGNTNGPAITCFDQPILDEIAAAGFELRPRKAPGLYGFIGAIEKFRALGLINNKHIPSPYLRSSFTQRLAVLQGLMDTDGTVGANGTCELTLCHERLAADALELIRSLGIKCKSTPSDASYVDKHGNRKVTSTRHRMHFTTSLPVFRLPRKLDRLPAETRSTQGLLYIESIERVESEQVRCISVDAADGMYLTHGFIPTHNSLLVRSLFGWHCLERVNPSGKPGYPGTHNTLIAFESKGDGVAKYIHWAHTLGDKVLAIDVADARTPAIDLFAVPGDNAAKAVFFTNALKYTFGADAIGPRSFPTIVAILTAAMSVDERVIDSIEDRDDRILKHGMSPLYYAYQLLAGTSDKIAVQLALAIKSLGIKLRERGEPDETLEQAYIAISSLFEDRTESARRPFLEPPRNKFEQLLILEDWWTPSRKKVSWTDIIEGHRSVVINTGSSPSGILLDDEQNQQISSLLMYSLQNALKRTCSGWLEQDRSVSIFADELSLLAGTSPEVVAWIRDQGRSYGIRAMLATQRPEQLGPALRNNFLTYATLISFAQTDVTTAGEVAANVGSNGEWTTEDIQHLEPYHVVVRSEVDQRRQSAFIVKLPNFEADVLSYATAQAYTHKPAGAYPW